MGKVWRLNPFYWVGRKKMRFASESSIHGYAPANFTIKQRDALDWRNLNPFRWSKRAIRVFTSGFFMIMLPIYVFIGMQPAVSINTDGLPELAIASIGLNTAVSSVELTNHELVAPANIAGSYSSSKNKTLIIGHSSTVFKNLHKAKTGDLLTYNDQTYRIVSSEVYEKSAISMADILSSEEEETIIIMTCAGQNLPNQDATHRLIITAVLLNQD